MWGGGALARAGGAWARAVLGGQCGTARAGTSRAARGHGQCGAGRARAARQGHARPGTSGAVRCGRCGAAWPQAVRRRHQRGGADAMQCGGGIARCEHEQCGARVARARCTAVGGGVAAAHQRGSLRRRPVDGSVGQYELRGSTARRTGVAQASAAPSTPTIRRRARSSVVRPARGRHLHWMRLTREPMRKHASCAQPSGRHPRGPDIRTGCSERVSQRVRTSCGEHRQASA
ncbi:hypothetical protein ABH920_001830 [Catenulispora sp. EB89]